MSTMRVKGSQPAMKQYAVQDHTMHENVTTHSNFGTEGQLTCPQEDKYLISEAANVKWVSYSDTIR